MKRNTITNNGCCKDTPDKQISDIKIGPTLVGSIKNMLVIVRQEIMERKKTLDMADGQLLESVLTQIKEDNLSFSNEEECLKYCYGIVRKIVWTYVNERESDQIISRLKSGDRLFAQKFFYGTNNNECNISRFRSKIIAQIKQTYHVDVSIEEFGNIVYTHLWANGTWSVLDNYAQKGSFFCWLERVCRHEVMKVLEDMNVINVSRERTTGNTRLLGSSISPDVWYLIISDLMPDGLSKELLIAVYVDHMKEKAMIKEFHMEAEELRDKIKSAELILKDKLIRSANSYEEFVLRDKSLRNIEVSEDYVKDFVKWLDEKNDISPLADVFGVNLSSEELSDKVVKFLYDFSEKLQWSDEDRMIWQLRFIENVPPVEVAERCGRARSWLDTRYSRLNQRFTAAIRKWWKNNSK